MTEEFDFPFRFSFFGELSIFVALTEKCLLEKVFAPHSPTQIWNLGTAKKIDENR
jgi:hypothetical protein